jgi:hypothetical protein
MRKRIVIGVLVMIVAGVLVYVVSQPKRRDGGVGIRGRFGGP